MRYTNKIELELELELDFKTSHTTEGNMSVLVYKS